MIDNEFEQDPQQVYVYQGQVKYTETEIVLVKAYTLDHAKEIIEANFGDKLNYELITLEPATNDTTNSISKKTQH